MSLAPGVRLGAYEVLRLIGVGGMGEVYQARDTRLDRVVAIKVLPENAAGNHERRQRFEREARAVAALNHPHICDLHDVGAHDSVEFLVMEYVDGQTLAERLLRGPLPTADVLRYAIELADALDHAHRRGLVHRDLKPGNVMVTPGGAKLLDFGLSKLQPTPDLIELSTIAPGPAPLTAQGAVLGTYPYMAPEQLEGRETDARVDLFALGAIIYEMATGRRAFTGATPASLIGAILHTDPPAVSTLQPLTPPGLDRLVTRCLAKNPDDRWQTARDLLLELKWVAHDPAAFSAGHRTRGKRAGSGFVLAAAVVALAAIAAAVAYIRWAPAEETVARLTFAAARGVQLAEVRVGGPVAISPDGKRVAYVGAGSGSRQLLWVQPLDSLTAQPLEGTEGAAYPFWSPDSRSIGFFAKGRLRRIDAAGGPPHVLCDVTLPRGGTWNRAGVIVFSANAGQHLYQVSAKGGKPSVLGFDRKHSQGLWPSFLPDGNHFLYFGRRIDPGIYLASLDPSVGARRLVEGLYAGAAYAAPHHIMFARGGAMGVTLFAQGINLERLELTGEPVPLAERVPFYPALGLADFSISENGRLMHGTLARDLTSLAWFDQTGRAIESVPGASGYQKASLSPDERTIGAHSVDLDTLSQDVWLIDAIRGGARKLTSNPGLDNMGLWSPDGRRIVYGSTRDDQATNSYLKTIDGTDVESPLFPPGERELQQITDWSGNVIVYGKQDPNKQWDLWTVRAPEPGGTASGAAVYLSTEFNEHSGALSPDRRWIAYESDQSGPFEVYVDAFPQPGAAPVRVSTAGGTWPRWRHDGTQLYYVAPDLTLMASSTKIGASFAADTPRALFKLPVAAGPRSNRPYEPTRNGQRFLVNVSQEAPPPPVSVLLNWPALLRR
jgi:Tol biopolymer transport system component